MTDIPQRPEDSSEGFLQEIDEGRVIGNVELLRMQFVGRKPDDPDDRETRLALQGIKDKGAMTIEGGALHRITIQYNTRTGEISPSNGTVFGDSSVIRTDLIEKGSTKAILLHLSEGIPAAWEIDEAISGIQTGPDTGTRRIMPERVIPEEGPNIRGINEVWGQSEYVDNAHGDLVILKTIRQFNQTFGPPK